jgi:UDP-GlcNAc3NAcA epimerase
MIQPKIIAIIGARPQFIKHFPLEKATKGRINLITIHTGQHYDSNMSDVFFNQLGMSHPDYMLQLGGGNHGEQTGKMMIEIEKIVINEVPQAIIVYGDTNSTIAGALVASKLHIPLFHIEAGLRSYNKKMPEEVNRILTDHISDLLFVTSDIAIENLKKEGIEEGIFLVGDLMKDLVLSVKKDNLIGEKKIIDTYYYATIHRPYNTDSHERLLYILDQFNVLDKKVLLALHPRTNKLLADYNIKKEDYNNIIFIDPQSYLSNLNYMIHSDGIITDSGGIQKEAYWIQKKCVTLRSETEWVETVALGGNSLLFEDISSLEIEMNSEPSNWDESLYGSGNCAEQIVETILKLNAFGKTN